MTLMDVLDFFVLWSKTNWFALFSLLYRFGGAPVLPAGEGAVFAVPEVLPVRDVRSGVHGAGGGDSALQESLHLRPHRLRNAHEQVG